MIRIEKKERKKKKIYSLNTRLTTLTGVYFPLLQAKPYANSFSEPCSSHSCRFFIDNSLDPTPLTFVGLVPHYNYLIFATAPPFPVIFNFSIL